MLGRQVVSVTLTKHVIAERDLEDTKQGEEQRPRRPRRPVITPHPTRAYVTPPHLSWSAACLIQRRLSPPTSDRVICERNTHANVSGNDPDTGRLTVYLLDKGLERIHEGAARGDPETARQQST